jgi:plasmid stability protein
MARLTITLSDQTHRQLKVRAALHDRTIGDLIEEELALAREEHRRRARAALEVLRQSAAESVKDMTDDEIMELAVEETRRYRVEKQGGREADSRHR